MVWFLAGVFLLITILLLSGRGAFLIAGYNTASKKEKMQYDEKKLCRVMGGGMGIITIFMVVLASFGENPPGWLLAIFPVLIIVVVVVMLILCNTICKVKVKVNVSVEKTEETEEEKRRNYIIKLLAIVGSIMISMIIAILLFTGEVKVKVAEKEIKIEGSYYNDYQVPLESINSISYREGIHTGRRTNGWGSFKLNQGSFKNDEFGAYTLYSYTKCDSFIILYTSNRIVVINAETSEKTKELYEYLKAAANK